MTTVAPARLVHAHEAPDGPGDTEVPDELRNDRGGEE